MRDVARLTLVLMLICSVAGGTLAFVNVVTSERILKAKQLEEAESLSSALPEAEEFRDVSERLGSLLRKKEFDAISGVYLGYANGDPVGVVFRITARGYGGNIEAVVGVNGDGNIENVKVISQQETPGLGSKVSSPEFLKRFIGRDIGERIRLVKDGGDIAGITGATISSRALTRGVDQAVRLFAPVFRGEGREG